MGALSRAEAQELLSLLIEGHDLTNEGDFLQDVFVANYLQHNHNIQKALKATGVSYATYSAWKLDPTFKAKISFANQNLVAELFAKARELALAGETDMLKFLLSALDPAMYDSKYRAQALENEALAARAVEGNRQFTLQELRDLITNDPAGQYIDVTPSSEPQVLLESAKDEGPI